MMRVIQTLNRNGFDDVSVLPTTRVVILVLIHSKTSVEKFCCSMRPIACKLKLYVLLQETSRAFSARLTSGGKLSLSFGMFN